MSTNAKNVRLAWPDVLVWLGLGGMIAGVWGPWVAHANAGMAFNAIDLVEFVKFMTRARLTFIVRELFYLPMLAGAVGTVIKFQVSSFKFRVLLAVVASLLALVPLPPYPNLLHAYRSPEDGLSFWLSLGTLGLIAAAASLGGRLPRWVTAGVLLGLACSVLPAAWQFVCLAPPLSTLYGAPVQAGWGLALTGLGSLSLAMGAIRSMVKAR
ncbi:MAG: hypothetical protein JW850_01080 [Thermoflexales bacterium]|nr:hypothetical protein [Thermoflexales bacterium]